MVGFEETVVEEWLVKIVQSMFRNARSHIIVNETFSNDFLVQVGLNQGSVLSSLLFIIKLESLSREIKSGCLDKLCYGDDLVLVSETLNNLKGRLEA